jgi:hypothetical protein
MSSTTETLTAAELRQFTGTENWYKYGFLSPKTTYTDGIKYLVEKAGAYWLLDVIVSHQISKKVRSEEFQVWKLRKDREGNGCMITAEDGNDHVIAKQHVEYTDFPLPEIDLWMAVGGPNGGPVIMLPSEY